VAKINRRKTLSEHLSQWFIGASVCLKIWLGGKYLQVSPFQPFSAHHCSRKNRVPTPPWPCIVSGGGLLFRIRKRIYLGRPKTGFYVEQTGFRPPPIIKLNVKTNRNFSLFPDYYTVYTVEEKKTILAPQAYYIAYRRRSIMQYL